MCSLLASPRSWLCVVRGCGQNTQPNTPKPMHGGVRTDPRWQPPPFPHSLEYPSLVLTYTPFAIETKPSFTRQMHTRFHHSPLSSRSHIIAFAHNAFNCGVGVVKLMTSASLSVSPRALCCLCMLTIAPCLSRARVSRRGLRRVSTLTIRRLQPPQRAW